jgi:hypothetical protein
MAYATRILLSICRTAEAPCRAVEQSVWEFRMTADDGPAPRPASDAPPAWTVAQVE